jgi:hypothetical protein
MFYRISSLYRFALCQTSLPHPWECNRYLTERLLPKALRLKSWTDY